MKRSAIISAAFSLSMATACTTTDETREKPAIFQWAGPSAPSDAADCAVGILRGRGYRIVTKEPAPNGFSVTVYEHGQFGTNVAVLIDVIRNGGTTEMIGRGIGRKSKNPAVYDAFKACVNPPTP